MKVLRCLLLLMLLLPLPGCGILDVFFLPPAEDTVQELFEGANDAVREKDYVRAIDYYTRIKDNYPFSPYALQAELGLGDALYLDGRYADAVEAYKDFELLHPRHEAIPYVLYRIGMADLKAFISIDRPTTGVKEALEYFNRLRETYPDSEYAVAAEKEIRGARHILAEHELYQADVFWQMKKYGSAWKRYTFITEEYADVSDSCEHARTKGIAAYYLYREQSSEESRRAVEGSWRDWFSWM